MLTVLTSVLSIKVLWYVEDDLRWKTTFWYRNHLLSGSLGVTTETNLPNLMYQDYSTMCAQVNPMIQI